MKKTGIIIILVIIIAMGLLGVVLGNSASDSPSDRARDRIGKRFFPEKKPTWNRTESFNRSDFFHRVEDIDHRAYMVVKSTVTMINMTISIILIFIYMKIYREVKSDFTLGLLIVMFAFLVYAITSNPLFYSIFGYWGFGMGPFQMIPDIFGTIALSVLLYLSLK
ncbi:MAG: hypothetical protein QGH39_09050 [Candidatus Thermoplasmatota archaeon]|jgi:hypothetical protein|nr:hypothetical protein [Candidatus Thermoplasmatota archaeon]MDP7265688.1 hypothetical protein [Candidatus Thermoplasmatota archaeon]